MGNVVVAAALLLTFVTAIVGVAGEIALLKNGATDHVLVKRDGATDREDFARSELQKYFRRSAGITFAEVSEKEVAKHSKRIFIGGAALPAAQQALERIEPFGTQESLIATAGDDIFLLGGNIDGVNYAVYSFLENELGIRWYTAYGDVKIPRHRDLSLAPVRRRERPALAYRHITCYFYPLRPQKQRFLYANRLNIGFACREVPQLRSFLPYIGPIGHTLFYYMNPGKEYHASYQSQPKPSRANFFETNPAYFSMDRNGKRVKSMHLCFSNREMREVFTQQLNDVIKESGKTRGIVGISCQDVPGKLCHCPECHNLEEEYGTVGGPILDYLIQLCNKLKRQFPEILVSTLAYRKKQTEVPPKNVQRLPENLVIIFAPIDDNFAKNLAHETNRGTFENLKKWCRVSNHVWPWYYPNPYGAKVPFGNVKRLIEDTRLMVEAGIDGTFYEHDSHVVTSYNFSELQTWLLAKLFQNPACDTEALTREFTEFYYGPAARGVVKYMNELEGLREGMKGFLPWHTTASMYRYLTPERLLRWNEEFDGLENLVGGDDHRFHVRLLRITLDMELLRKHRELRRLVPGRVPTADEIRARLEATVNTLGDVRLARHPPYVRGIKKGINRLLLLARADLKPLPSRFDKYDPEDIRQAFPSSLIVKDKDAALGIASKMSRNEVPMKFGFYDRRNDKQVLQSEIPKSQIGIDRYKLYKLGRVKLTPDCLVWVTGSWRIGFKLEGFYTVGFPDTEWDVHVSMKFEGQAYSAESQSGENSISVDRVVLVRVRQALGRTDPAPLNESTS